MKKLLYFVCIRSPGHFLWEDDNNELHFPSFEQSKKIPGLNIGVIKHIDGIYTPLKETSGIYNECTVPPVRIIAWWDYSQDHRAGSNSALIGYGYNSGEEMLDDAVKIFPSVMNRQERPIKLEI